MYSSCVFWVDEEEGVVQSWPSQTENCGKLGVVLAITCAANN